jgi:hypothetical protein
MAQATVLQLEREAALREASLAAAGEEVVSLQEANRAAQMAANQYLLDLQVGPGAWAPGRAARQGPSRAVLGGRAGRRGRGALGRRAPTSPGRRAPRPTRGRPMSARWTT